MTPTPAGGTNATRSQQTGPGWRSTPSLQRDVRVALRQGEQDLRDALGTAGGAAVNVYHDLASTVFGTTGRPGLDSCLRGPTNGTTCSSARPPRLGACRLGARRSTPRPRRPPRLRHRELIRERHPVTLYQYVGPQGQLRQQGRKDLGASESEDRDAWRS